MRSIKTLESVGCLIATIGSRDAVEVTTLGVVLNGEGKLEGLQIGRAFAALIVAYFHSNMIFSNWPEAKVFAIPGLKEYGFLGVNFFFAISGYVIGAVCDKPHFTIKSFAIKRFFRLYPVYWAVILALVLLKACGVFLPTSYKFLNIVYSMTLLPHAEDVQPFLPVTWSLEFEVMFYFLAVLVVPFLGVWGLAAALFGLVYWTFQHFEPAFSFHLLRTLNADFLAGVLAYLLRRPLSVFPSWILISSGLFGYYNAVSGWSVPFSGSCGGFLLVAGLVNARWPWQVRQLRWLTKVGDASYSIYLVHFPMIWLLVKMTGTFGTPASWAAEPLRFSCLGICVWLSILAYRHIERPMIEIGNRLAAGTRRVQFKEQPSPLNTTHQPQTAE